jgi:hypothetical protein
MKIESYLTLFLLIPALNSFSQAPVSGLNKENVTTQVNRQDVDVSAQADTTKSSFQKNSGDAYIGGGFIFGPSDLGDQIKYGASREFIVGLGYVRKFVKWNGAGIDLYYKSTGYFLVQDTAKILPNSTQHNSEKISFDNLGGLIFDRFYIGKVFVDGGFYFDWAMVTKHETYDDFSVANAGGGSSTHSIDRNLYYLNSTNYGLTFRLGHITGVSLYFNYRLTNVFIKGTAQNPDLYYNLPFPPFVIGLVIGVH